MEKDKSKIVEDIKANLSAAKSVVFADYHCLSANQVNQLRQSLKDAGAITHVFKNTLVRRALDEQNIKDESLRKHIQGPTIAVFSLEDSISPIKALFDFAKTNENLTIKSGIFEGETANFEKLEVISNLPSKEQLLAQITASIKSPITGIVTTLGGVQRNFVYALSAIANKSEVAPKESDK